MGNHQVTKPPRPPVDPHLDAVARQVVDAAFKVHSTLGPGLVEKVYEACLHHELTKRGLPCRRQVAVPVVYDGVSIDADLRLDLLVAEALIVEVKAAAPNPVFQAQLLTYMKLSGHRLGLLINFHVPLIKDGIRRMVL